MFIHWGVDSQIGTVNSHSMVGASDDYLDRYINDLPKTFRAKKFDPVEWAELAKMVGMKYMVFITKHHNGFCMFNTKTTDFSIMHTLYAQDTTQKVIGAFRDQGIAIGLYYSPDDFWFIHKQGHDISRNSPESNPANNPALMAHDKEHIQRITYKLRPY